ncbi:MAG: hypothetical protein R3E87_21255 [Burkholderiaceae bacterium]
MSDHDDSSLAGPAIDDHSLSRLMSAADAADDPVFEWDPEPTDAAPPAEPVAALTIVDRRGILGALHHLCASSRSAGQGCALMVTVDGLVPLARERGTQVADRVRDEAYTRVSARMADASAAGLIDDEMLLMLFDDAEPERAVAHFMGGREDAGRIRLGDQRFAVGFSAAVTEIRRDDLPEAIVGRLCRALQRVMMSGSDQVEQAT